MKRIIILTIISFNMLFFIKCGNPNVTIALINCNLVDGTGSEVIQNAVIIIENEYIQSVGTISNLNIPKGTEIIDLQGLYILPGLINAHVHNGYNAENLREWAQSGITTVRDLNNYRDSPAQAFDLRNTLLNSNANARLIAAGPMVTTVGGYGSYPVSSPDDAEEKINELIDLGADFIKIAIEDDLQGQIWPMLSMEEISRIVQTAHNRNKKVSAHVSRSRHLNMAVTGGVDDIAHMIVDNLPDSLIALIIEKDIYWVPTLELWTLVSQAYSLNWNIVAINNLRRFVQAGGKVALGTDYDGFSASFELGMPMLEIQLMQEAGMTPMQIIIAGTINAAYVCDMENELGTIEPDKIADIIVVNGNPLDSLESLSNVEMVIHNGEIIKDSRGD